jgi:DNA-binding GntR family transcriptional regulator
METPRNARINHMSSEERAYAAIRGLISNRSYGAGDRLKYAELANMLKMSKTPIIAALSRLTEEGWVDHKPNCGYRVAKNSGASADRPTASDPLPMAGSLELLNAEFPVSEVTAPAASLNQAAYEAIKEQILKSRLVPGQRLVYSDLEQRLGVSKTPILNALSRLESEGYVQQKRNVGYHVREFTLKEVEDLFDARQAMELANLDFVLAMRTNEDVRELERIHQEYVHCPSPIYDETRVAINRRFHLRIAQMGRNGMMLRYITQLYDFFDLRMKFSLSFLPPERMREIDAEHEQIVAALRDRSKTRLMKAFRIHLGAPVRDIFRYLQNTPA